MPPATLGPPTETGVILTRGELPCERLIDAPFRGGALRPAQLSSSMSALLNGGRLPSDSKPAADLLCEVARTTVARPPKANLS